MHMADALLSPPVAAAMYGATAAVSALAIRKLKKDDDDSRLPTVAVTAALVFAGQMVNYSIPGTGASGHICGGLLLAAVLGPEAGFLALLVILTIQCLLFGDGGLLALGANVWNMGFYGCFAGYHLVWRPLAQNHLKAASAADACGSARRRIVAASVLGCVLALQLGAFSVVLETSLSGITALPFGAFCGIMLPIHLAIGLVEGLVTAAILLFLYQARPEMLHGFSEGTEGKTAQPTGGGKALLVLAVSVLFVAGGLSLLASDHPDGLEWSLFGAGDGIHENMALDEENYGIHSSLSDDAAALQQHTAVLPDYGLPDGDGAAGTALSGLIGSALVAAAAALACACARMSKKRKRS